MKTPEMIFIGFLFLIFMYAFGYFSFFIYLKRKFKKACKLQDLKLFRNLEEEIGKRNSLYWIFPTTADLFLFKIKEEVTKIHKENEKMIGVELDFLLIQARDEYENLNGLTTSEDPGEHS